MHLSPLFSSKKIVLSPPRSGLFFCACTQASTPHIDRFSSAKFVHGSVLMLALGHTRVTIAAYTEFICNTCNRYA